jgi:superfamily II RNA helicase
MVIVCDMPYPKNDQLMIVDSYMRPGLRIMLSDFQKWAIKAIVEGDNVLITAHTGSGKTLPAEFAINYFAAQRKKVIYASPIKALSNQKLYDMRKKFPHISFGILTGDCKDNPEADVLIMTTEILRNTLLNKSINNKNIDSRCEHVGMACGCNAPLLPLLFEMDFENELAAVVFDEVHYINDAERGSVWEQAILMLPPQVQLVMLSATIDRPQDFAGWIETEKANQLVCAQKPIKKMYLAPTYTRIVPLTHYMWLSVNEGVFKKAAKSPYEKKIEEMRGVPVPIATSVGVYNEPNYYKMKDVLDYLYKNNTYIKRPFVLNDLLRYLKAKEMLPAICFVFSRKHVEQAAAEISFSLFETDSGLPALVDRECRHILASKLPNHQEYLDLPEYKMIVGLLEKGIAIHHAGIIPVLREMVELLFEKGFIRLLLATETFAVGLNMPTKTVIFAGLTKYNGSTMRLLYPHEYTQMAGRAGRRGLDTIGHVFHCVNLFELPSSTEYKHLLTGPPQKLTSKFKISFNLCLAMLDAKQDLMAFMEQSMLSADIQRDIRGCEMEEERDQALILKKEEQLSFCRTPKAVLEKYASLNSGVSLLTNAARKKIRLEMNALETEYKFLLTDLPKLTELQEAQLNYATVKQEKKNTTEYIANTVNYLTKILVRDEFVCKSADSYTITNKGRLAAQLQEVHPLAMGDLYYGTNKFAALDSAQLAGLFSCFYPVNVSDEFKSHHCTHSSIHEITLYMAERLDYYLKAEQEAYLFTGANYDIAYDLLPYVIKWCDAGDEVTCKQILQMVKAQTGVFIGEFVKALLKVNAIALEFERVCEMTANITLLEKLREIPKLTLKYIATSQSLYL